MLLKEAVITILAQYKKYEEVLSEETKLLVANDYVGFHNLVERKIAIINNLAVFEQKRVNQFGEFSLNELLEKSGDVELNRLKGELVSVLQSITEKTETNQILMDQINSYKDMFLGALTKEVGAKNSYSKDKKFDSSNQTSNLLNKRL